MPNIDLTRYYPPTFLLEADGGLAFDIIPYIKRFEFIDQHKKPDELKIIFINDRFRWIDDQRFAAGVTYRVRWGYPTLWSKTLVFKVQKAIPDFPQKEVPTITMISWDSRIDLAKEAVAHNYGPVSSSEVARVLAKKWGLKQDIQESNDARKQDRIQSARTTDLGYLAKLADDLNFRFDVIDDTLVFKKHEYLGSADFEYTYFYDKRGVIREFKPEIKDKLAKGKIGVATSDPKTGESKDNKPKDKPATGTSSRNAKDGKVFKEQGTGPLGASPEGAKVAALQAGAAKDKIDLNADKATLKIIGDPRLRKGMKVRVLGVGRFYEGTWYVAGTHHTIDSKAVYVTELKLERTKGDATKKSDDTKVGKANTTGAGGEVGYVARVAPNGKVVQEFTNKPGNYSVPAPLTSGGT